MVEREGGGEKSENQNKRKSEFFFKKNNFFFCSSDGWHEQSYAAWKTKENDDGLFEKQRHCWNEKRNDGWHFRWRWRVKFKNFVFFKNNIKIVIRLSDEADEMLDSVFESIGLDIGTAVNQEEGKSW